MSRKQTWIVAVLAIVAMLAVGAWLGGWLNFGPTGPTLSPAQAQALIHTKNVGLGQLENQELQAGLSAFDQIAAQVPADPLGPRNVAVARVLELGVEDEPAEPPLIEAAQTALAAMREIEGETAPYHWLALRAAIAAQNFAQAETHLAALIAADADDPAAWYARFRVGRIAGAREVSPEALSALAKAFELRPTNSWLLVEWLRATGSQLNGEVNDLPDDAASRATGESAIQQKYARLSEQLAAARPTMQAFAQVIQAHTRIDVLAMLDEAASAAKDNKWQIAATRMLTIANVLLPHSVLDRQAVLRHPLEFVLDRFQPEFYTSTKAAEAVQPPAITVSFAATPNWQIPSELAQALGPVVDFTLADFDLDGRLDVVALSAEKVVVWSRRDDPAVWQEVASAAASGYSRLAVQDLDADFDETSAAMQGRGGPAPAGEVKSEPPRVCTSADVDLILYGQPGVALVENRFDRQSGQRSLVPVAKEKLPAEQLSVTALTAADLEADGDLDLAMGTASGLRLWRNLSEWQFADMSAQSSLPGGLTDAKQMLAFDWDRDVDIDVLVAAPSGGGWLENLRHGQFRWQPFAGGLADLQASQALEMIDADGNAVWDLLTGGKAGLRHVSIGGPPLAAVKAGPAAVIAELPATQMLTWDYDNDGWEDCLAWNGERLALLRGLVENKFEPAELLAAAPQNLTQAAAGDLDADGDQDLAVLADGNVQLLENQGGNQNHWIDVALAGQQIKGQQASPSGRVTPYGVGSLLELKSGERYQARVVRGQGTHFGLGQASEADVIRVGWLNGVPQNIIRPAADLFVCEQQILNTSCPYLYAWDGKKFVFVTDLLWNAPLGLQLAAGQLAPWRDWEYLKIPGEQLAAKDGHYLLQATAELWEADYFDHVRLIAVDHPAQIAVYSNEKVGPPSLAEFKIHTVEHPRSPAAATTSGGRDVLSEVAAEDGTYARPFERKLRQGVVEDHYLKLDLGELGDATQVTLFLTGWVYPAATSINVGLSQGGSIAPPQPPSLEMADAAGQWHTVQPFMGFPGGKTKTISVEVPMETHTSRSPVRLRIRTTMEFYWDHIFFTVDETPAEVRTSELKLASADLHPRGFSRVVRDESNGPERFLYDEVSSLPKWPPMLGRFTRYGDVLPLLTARDDRLLVMGAGDETTLRFAAIDPPPPGWKRDFLLYSVGWDKDANLETVLGRSSEPLPFEAMSAYPWPADEQLPDSPAYREYLRTYQTRQQSPAYWSAVRRFAPAKSP
jgi:tetratricopeptide (TPR) repeat protein